MIYFYIHIIIKMILTLLILLSIQTDSENSITFEYPHPDNSAKELHTLQLIKDGKVSDNSHVFNENELQIRNIKHIIYPDTDKKEITVSTSVNCGIPYTSINDDPKTEKSELYYSSVEIVLNEKGDIEGIFPVMSLSPCASDAKQIDNSHIKTKDSKVFYVDYTFQQKITPEVISYVNQLARNGKLVFEKFTIKAQHFKIDSIEYNELSLHNFHGIGINLNLLCDIPLNNTEVSSHPYTIKFFLNKDGSISELFGWFKGQIGKSCD